MGIRIEGEVRQALTVTSEDLAALPGQVPDVSTVVAGRHGAGVALRSVLERAGLRTGATHLTIESDDASFAASIPLPSVDAAVLVYALDGAPLPRDKGGPFRLLIPDAARCGSAEVDKCANVKSVGVLRVDAEHGRDTRPTTKAEHVAMHRKPGHGHSH